MKVYPTSAYDKLRPLEALKEAAAADRFGVHTVVDRPEQADFILFVEQAHYVTDPYYRELRSHPLVRRYPGLCLMYNEHDRPWYVLPGLYCNMRSRYIDPKRQRACMYLYLYNPYVTEAIARGEEPRLLYSFMGTNNAPVRKTLFALQDPEGCVQDTTHFNPFLRKRSDADVALQQEYARLLVGSRFVLCPRGRGTSTSRLFETLLAGRVPVVLSDQWVPPAGPDWDAFTIRIPESEAARVPELLRREDHRWAEMAARARAAWDAWFAEDVRFHHLMEECALLLKDGPIRDGLAQRLPSVPYIEWTIRTVVHAAKRRIKPEPV